MKFIFKKILQQYLKYLAKITLLIHRPQIIAVAGSINKTFTKDEVCRVLNEVGLSARSNPRAFNTEIGLSLSILDLSSGYGSYAKWLPVILRAPLNIFQKNFPRFLILEFGISDPGDMKFLLSVVKPHIAIITDITQRYIEGFDNVEELIGEYEYLAAHLDKKGLLILNYDNMRVRALAKISRARATSFGLENGADWKGELGGDNVCQAVKIQGKNKEFKLIRHGMHHVYSALIGQIIAYVSQKNKV
ncbi:MAG: Mur ligase family protein [Patescibacteria group bacterium]